MSPYFNPRSGLRHPRFSIQGRHAGRPLRSFPILRSAFRVPRFFSLLLLLALAACVGPGLTPTPAATQAPQDPTASPTPAGSPTPAPTASATPLPSLTPAPAAVAGRLFVDASQNLGEISPLVYGSNYGPWLFVTLDMRPALKDAHLTLLRWPGGNWGDENDISEFQLDQFIDFCKEMGAEPSISVRLLGGTPEKAAALVRYANVTRGYKVKWWSIGNEPNLYPNYDLQKYLLDWRKFADAMRAVDPTIKLIGPDTNQFTYTWLVTPPSDPTEKSALDFLTAFLKANGNTVDLVAIHRYPFPRAKGDGPPSISDLQANSAEWDNSIPALRALIRQNAGRDLPVGVTEVNSSWSANLFGEATMDSHYNAIWWGDCLGRMIRQGVELVAQFAITGQYGLVDKYDPYPIYYVYQMYRHFGTQRILASSDDPALSIFAARRSDGALTLMLVNLGKQAVEKPLEVKGFTSSGPAETWLFDPKHKAEQQAPALLGDKVNLPGQSMTLIVITGQ